MKNDTVEVEPGRAMTKNKRKDKGPALEPDALLDPLDFAPR